MLQISYIRQNRDFVKERLAVKHFAQPGVVDDLIRMDEELRQLKSQTETMQASINALSKEIGMLMGKGQRDEAEAKKQEVASLKSGMAEKTSALASLEDALNQLLVTLPNLPHESVPQGKSATDNVVDGKGGKMPELPANAKPHWELIREYDLIDFETGAKITGSGFPLFKGKGARLQRALIQFFLDYNTEAGYVEYLPPLMVNEATAYGTGQLPDKEGQMYHVTADGFYLIPTAEVPVTNVYRDEILKESELPIKMTAYTPCFRREAGSFGADVRGLNRVHQFDKVEIIQMTKPERSYHA
ncbi:MAG TPA: serine--tRNA ligase, partial [Chitinophagaceae bacterium]|nr:serine--tRNA ligase [Chitinophagaceae bacterium]